MKPENPYSAPAQSAPLPDSGNYSLTLRVFCFAAVLRFIFSLASTALATRHPEIKTSVIPMLVTVLMGLLDTAAHFHLFRMPRHKLLLLAIAFNLASYAHSAATGMGDLSVTGFVFYCLSNLGTAGAYWQLPVVPLRLRKFRWLTIALVVLVALNSVFWQSSLNRELARSTWFLIFPFFGVTFFYLTMMFRTLWTFSTAHVASHSIARMEREGLPRTS